jgi:hypothetical protein
MLTELNRLTAFSPGKIFCKTRQNFPTDKLASGQNATKSAPVSLGT